MNKKLAFRVELYRKIAKKIAEEFDDEIQKNNNKDAIYAVIEDTETQFKILNEQLETVLTQFGIDPDDRRCLCWLTAERNSLLQVLVEMKNFSKSTDVRYTENELVRIEQHITEILVNS